MPVIRAPRATFVPDADDAIYAQPRARTMGPCTYRHRLDALPVNVRHGWFVSPGCRSTRRWRCGKACILRPCHARRPRDGV